MPCLELHPLEISTYPIVVSVVMFTLVTSAIPMFRRTDDRGSAPAIRMTDGYGALDVQRDRSCQDVDCPAMPITMEIDEACRGGGCGDTKSLSSSPRYPLA